MNIRQDSELHRPRAPGIMPFQDHGIAIGIPALGTILQHLTPPGLSTARLARCKVGLDMAKPPREMLSVLLRSGDGRVVPTNQSARGDRQGSHRGNAFGSNSRGA